MRLVFVSCSEATWTKLEVLTAYGPPGLCADSLEDFGVNSFFGVQLALFFFFGVTVSAVRTTYCNTPIRCKILPLFCHAPNVDNNLKSGRFWATSIALFGGDASLKPRYNFTLQWPGAEAVKIVLASTSSGNRAIWPNRERRRDWATLSFRREKRCGTFEAEQHDA